MLCFCILLDCVVDDAVLHISGCVTNWQHLFHRHYTVSLGEKNVSKAGADTDGDNAIFACKLCSHDSFFTAGDERGRVYQQVL